MPKYIMANLKIPVEINESGRFVLLNKYTKTDVYGIDFLPPEGEENLHDKISAFLKKLREEEKMNLEKLKLEEKEDKEEEDKEKLERKEEEDKEKLERKEEEDKEKLERKEEEDKEKLERKEEEKENNEKYLKINKNNIKMRKHNNVMSFKNIKKSGSGTYTRKSYDQDYM
jgi:hypothetical protein